MARLTIALVLLATACTAAPEPTRPPPVVSPGDRRSVEETARGFLDAYAAADVTLLATTVGGPHLEEWVRRLPDQEAGGGAGATLELRALDVIGVHGDRADVSLDATLALPSPAGDDDAARVIGGPMTLLRNPAAPSGWSVVDAVLDGRSMRRSITLYPDAVVDGGGLRLEVRSLYQFTSGTVANVAVTNTGMNAVRVDRRRSLIQAAGRFVGSTSASPALLERLRPGSQVEGTVSFHGIPLEWLPEKLMLRLDGRSRPVTLDLPLQAYADSRA